MAREDRRWVRSHFWIPAALPPLALWTRCLAGFGAKAGPSDHLRGPGGGQREEGSWLPYPVWQGALVSVAPGTGAVDTRGGQLDRPPTRDHRAVLPALGFRGEGLSYQELGKEG